MSDTMLLAHLLDNKNTVKRGRLKDLTTKYLSNTEKTPLPSLKSQDNKKVLTFLDMSQIEYRYKFWNSFKVYEDKGTLGNKVLSEMLSETFTTRTISTKWTNIIILGLQEYWENRYRESFFSLDTETGELLYM